MSELSDDDTETKSLILNENMIMALKRAAVTTPSTTTPDAAATQVISQEEKDLHAEAVVNTAEGKEPEVLDPEPEAEAEHRADVVNQAAEATSDNAEDAQAANAAEGTGKEPEVQVEERAVVVKSSGLPAKQSNTDRTKGAAAEFTKSMAEDGFEGMELTGMSFDRLKMHEGKFQLGSEELSLGEEIFVNIMSTRTIYVIRQHDGQKAEMYYSYDPDGATFTDGSSAEETKAEWLADGYGDADSPLQIKEYIEGMAQLVNREDEWNGHMVSMSIPPASKQRLSGAFAVGMRKFQCKAGDLIIKCTVGKKIGTGDEAFRPWVFTADSMMG